jgi:hypothetical protein
MHVVTTVLYRVKLRTILKFYVGRMQTILTVGFKRKRNCFLDFRGWCGLDLHGEVARPFSAESRAAMRGGTDGGVLQQLEVLGRWVGRVSSVLFYCSPSFCCLDSRSHPQNAER